MTRLLAYLVLYVVQAALILLLVDAQWVEKELLRERTWTTEQWGETSAQHIQRQAAARYEAAVVASGAVAWSYSALIPDPRVSQQGMEVLAPQLFVWLRHRIDALWWLVYQALYRLQLIRAWLPYIGSVAFAAMVEGLVQRAVKRANVVSASGDRYAIAQGGLLILLIAPLLYLSAPLAVTPLCIPVWGGLVAVCVGLLSANLQQEV